MIIGVARAANEEAQNWVISWEGWFFLKKDIYIIKNSINNKVYIGQSTNAEYRWKRHIWDAKYESKYGINKSILHKAMMKYGIENFYYEILESQIDNYNDREKYWIDYYKSITPNGYNITPGGQGTGEGIDHPCSIFKTPDDLMKCIEEIASSDKTFENIAKKFGCNPEVISAINLGNRYKINNIEYPLRQTRYSQELLKQIAYSLEYELDLSMKEIAKKYNVDTSQLSMINQGRIHYIANKEYPLRAERSRDTNTNIVALIIRDIVISDLCMSDIAKKYNVSKMCVSNINNGITYHQDYLKYPLREQGDHRNKGRKNFIDRDDILKIHELLKGSTSIKEIAKNFDCSDVTIRNINGGKIKKYIIENVKYPIRQLKNQKPVSTIRA